MIKQLLDFNDNPTAENALNLIRNARLAGDFSAGVKIGTYCSKFINDLYFLDEYGICQYYMGDYQGSICTYQKLLKDFPNLEKSELDHMLDNMRFSIRKTLYDIDYNREKVLEICNRNIEGPQIISFSMTTCKRMDLFTKTMNSFIKNCADIHLISKFFIVDDQSSEDDTKLMAEMYPFITLIKKSMDDKGHAKSMNMIKDIVTTPYLLAFEDDWILVSRRNYITDCIKILQENHTYGQVLLNRNSAELIDFYDLLDGNYKITKSGIRYFEHVCDTDNKYTVRNIKYWPHFSLNPSVIRTDIFKRLGDFKLTTGGLHFEMDYAYRYMNTGYITCFLDSIHCHHIGRLHSDRKNPDLKNAYDLNNETQF
jgi:tetratricopeptide (TPR) repeat protein